MKKSFGYYILMGLTWPMKLFPLEFHYYVSDLLYFLIYRLVGYRKSVVVNNLSNAFPELSSDERKKIEVKFYHWLADLFIETLYFAHIDIEKEKGRIEIDNIEFFEKFVQQDRNIIVMMGHLGNWEFIQIFASYVKGNYFGIYKKLNNKAFDEFFRHLRGQLATPLEMKQTYRKLYNETIEKRPYIALSISDQRPVRGEIKHWVNFMNQEAPVMLGTEKIAKKTNAAVFYAEMIRKKRGCYTVRFKLICENAQTAPDFEITDTFMAMVEGSIKQAPDQYLWTHKRWKFKREDF